MKKLHSILVTGGNGYIGSMMCQTLQANGFQVDNFDIKHTNYLQNDRKIIGDLKNKNDIYNVLKAKKYSGVFHFAGLIDVADSLNEEIKYFQNNVIGSFNLISSMIETNTNNLIFSSSASVYKGKNKPLLETDTLNPISNYAKNKLSTENILSSFHLTNNFKSICLRYFNASGADLDNSIGENHNPETHLIPLAIKALYENKKFKVYGNDYDTEDGTCIRDYIHIKDICNAHLLGYFQLKDNSIQHDIFNIGKGKGYSVLQIIKKIEEISEKKLNYNFAERRKGDADILVADVNKSLNVLHWQAKHSLDNIIGTSIEYYERYGRLIL